MDITIYPRKLRGTIAAIPSKSHAHRLLICAALADKPTEILCSVSSRDIQATAACLAALGAAVQRTDTGYLVSPIRNLPKEATLPCCESGSTLRFLLPIVGALGVDATFIMEGRLSQRPLSPLWEVMERKGCSLHWAAEDRLRCRGQLKSGEYVIEGTVSSQFLSGLLLAFPLMDGPSTLTITGETVSRPYFEMTKEVIGQFGGTNGYCSPGNITAEGDWSSAAFYLGINGLGSHIAVTGLNETSVQGDKAITTLLDGFSLVDAMDIPDLVPVLSVLATRHGAKFTNTARLRLKESDRVASVCAMLKNLGIETETTENTLTVQPGTIQGGSVDSFGDHRIAMAAAIAATCATGPVTIRNADCVDKSYPGFWEDYKTLGGHYEFHIR